jgi:hypothetical protein
MFYLSYVFVAFLVPCCDVRYDFRIKTMFGSPLHPFVCSRADVLYVCSRADVPASYKTIAT